jgi:2-polyprenyl-3-methyl-5-hydroxy-6-metoxy-1,4-benzoquinol methylase
MDPADTFFDPGEFALRVSIENDHYWHVHRRQVIHEELLRAGSPAAERLIEIGCGIGTVATYLNELGFSVDYADVHCEALTTARRLAERRLGERILARRFLQLDVTKGPMPNDYGGALLFDVLEHLPDDREALSNVRASLRPGSLVFFTVPAFTFLWSPWDDIERHKRRYTSTQVLALAASSGLDVVRCSYFFAPLFFAALGVKALRRGKALAFKNQKTVRDIRDFAEVRTNGIVNRGMCALLSLENPLRRTLGLPLGTSILCVARVR